MVHEILVGKIPVEYRHNTADPGKLLWVVEPVEPSFLQIATSLVFIQLITHFILIIRKFHLFDSLLFEL